MDYNYTDAPYFANLVRNKELEVDGTHGQNIVIEKRVVNEEPPHETTTTFYTYNATGLSVRQVDLLTRQKIQELNG